MKIGNLAKVGERGGWGKGRGEKCKLCDISDSGFSSLNVNYESPHRMSRNIYILNILYIKNFLENMIKSEFQA